ncbi:YeaH/YhbH family protein [Teredinibacter purpureus]|uniref:YeaH/YhbH family protein n=1 Tax=Teredinibacter purpureus TaxID=2731756 RepID=UPI0005F823D9|nr:YeaH/YhbH family protein [Teredinibacter purpureus]
MSYIIDRRLNSKKKSMVNRQRFLRRYRKHIKKAVSDAVDKRSITDVESGEHISIPSRDLSEPLFQHGSGGRNTRVLPGNDQFSTGDHIPRPSGGGSGGKGSGASDKGEGEDEFIFQISQEEFLNFLFEDLALPNLVKRQLSGNEEFEFRRAGVSNEGSPGKINVIRSLRSANSRRIALTAKKRRKLKAIEEQLIQHEPDGDATDSTFAQLNKQAEALREKIKRVPWLDDFDLKYNLQVKYPIPTSKAVMFCLMDVSGSMDQATKDIAKRFFLLLYLFLQRNYEKTDVVFIRHHTSAKEVDEQEFFYSRETGGTIVSSALHLMDDVIKSRYPENEWNIYGAQASDGDNWNDDSSICYQVLTEKILPKVQYFSYIEITTREHQALWHSYEEVLTDFPHTFAMKQLFNATDIYPVFKQLFQKQTD